MTGAGHCREMVGARPEVIGERLDEISLTGAVAPTQAHTDLKSITALEGIGFDAAGRLLCMKRPDPRFERG